MPETAAPVLSDPLLKPEEVAAMLAVNVTTVRNWRRDGTLPHVRLGRDVEVSIGRLAIAMRYSIGCTNARRPPRPERKRAKLRQVRTAMKIDEHAAPQVEQAQAHAVFTAPDRGAGGARSSGSGPT
jgi:excisionase family DNA binding protein